MKIDTERMKTVANALRGTIRALEKSRHHHPESGYGQMCDKWKKDADWLSRLALKISSPNISRRAAGQGMARQGTARHGKARHGKARTTFHFTPRGWAWQGKARQGTARKGQFHLQPNNELKQRHNTRTTK